MKMDKKTLIGIGLMVVLLVGYMIYMSPSKEEREKAKKRQEFVQDSIRKANLDKHIADSIAEAESKQPVKPVVKLDSNLAQLPDSLKQMAVDSLEKVELGKEYGPFAADAAGQENVITVTTDKFVLNFSTLGGRIASAQMLGYQSYNSRFVTKKTDTLELWIPDESTYSVTLPAGGKVIETNNLYFTTDAKSFKISGKDKKSISFKAFANGTTTSYIEYVYTVSGDDYMIDFDVNMVGLEKIIDPNAPLSLTWVQATPTQEKEVSKERESSNIYYGTTEKEVNQLKGGVKGTEKTFKKELKFVSFKQQFFSTALVFKQDYKEDITLKTKPAESDKVMRLYVAEMDIPYNYGAQESFGMQMYMGPNHRNTLKAYDMGLAKQINTGQFFLIEWINELVILVFNYFDGLGLNYGIIILLLTIIIKLITMPLIYRTFVSSAKMRLLKPDIDALNDKFKPEEAMQKQQAIMQLYRKAGVSPLAGCIPALLQMPILLAMISFFPGAFELRQQALLWANDLSTFDSIVDLPFKIPMYGSHISLFALLMTGTTIIYTRMNSGQMTATGGIQAQQMKVMMYLMPVVFLIFLNSYSAALSYYYFLSNLISILIMLFIRKFMIDEKKLHAKIEENKKKTPKKSKWMERLEEVQKVRTEQMRQQQQKGGKKK